MLAISRCLLGDTVRYDGQSQYNPQLLADFNAGFRLLAICPEVEIGLGVPRPALQLCGPGQPPEMLGRDDPAINISQLMNEYCCNKPLSLRHICGYIFKSKSPSCGLHDTPVFNHGQIIETGPGLFAQAVIEYFPGLPVADEQQLSQAASRQQFIRQLLDYDQQYRTGNP